METVRKEWPKFITGLEAWIRAAPRKMAAAATAGAGGKPKRRKREGTAETKKRPGGRFRRRHIPA
nr:hypothetical protein [Cupriavidus gilardii]